MLAQPSLLSIVACIVYALVSGCAVWAWRAARYKKQQAWHYQAWVLIACFFALLIISRLLGLEELLRSDLRETLQAQDLVANRRSIQGPIIAGALILFGAGAMIAAYFVSQRIAGRRNLAVVGAICACGVMIATIALRTISLHALDRLLNGPLKLNWVGDIGASLVVLGAAVVYVRIVNGKLGRRH